MRLNDVPATLLAQGVQNRCTGLILENLVEWTCLWCFVENKEIRGKCLCKTCGQPRGSSPS